MNDFLCVPKKEKMADTMLSYHVRKMADTKLWYHAFLPRKIVVL